MKDKKQAPVQREHLIEVLESIVRDYRAGRGDVLSRIAYGRDADSEGCIALSRILALAFFGSRAFPKVHGRERGVTDPDATGIWCLKSEYVALVAIGAGSAERGAARVIGAAIAWMRADRSGMARWTSRALPKLREHRSEVNRMASGGMLSSEIWDIPVADEDWREALDAPFAADPGMAPWQRTGPDDLVRAMALAWHRGDPVAVKRIGRAA